MALDATVTLKRTSAILRGFFEPVISSLPRSQATLFSTLRPEFQHKIYASIYRLAGSPENVESNWGELHVFDSMPRLQLAIHELASSIFDGLNSMQKDFVAGWVYHHAQRPTTTDPHWGEHHAKDDTRILLHSLVDYLEIDPEIQEMQAALSEWLTDERRGPDEQRETAAQRILNFIADPLRTRPHGENGNDHILDLSSLNLSDVTVLHRSEIGSRVGVLDLFNNRLTDLPRFFPYFPHLIRLDVSDNMLTSLHVESLTRLPRLDYMTVGQNRFSRATSIDLQTRFAGELNCFGLFDGQNPPPAPAPQPSAPQPHRLVASMPRAPQLPAAAPEHAAYETLMAELARQWAEEHLAGQPEWYRDMFSPLPRTAEIPAPAARAPQPSSSSLSTGQIRLNSLLEAAHAGEAGSNRYLAEVENRFAAEEAARYARTARENQSFTTYFDAAAEGRYQDTYTEFVGILNSMGLQISDYWQYYQRRPRPSAAPSRAPQPSPVELHRHPDRPAPAAPGVIVDIPGTSPYSLGISDAVRKNAEEIKKLEKEYDELSDDLKKLPANKLPNHFICGISLSVMSIPIFDARHPLLQAAMKKAAAPGAKEEEKAAVNNRALRHAVDRQSMEDNIRANPHSALCGTCRHPLKREYMRIDTALQDEILAFLKQVLKK